MRELKIGDQTIRVRATPLALLFYKQEFKSDLLGDLLKMLQGMIGIQYLLGNSDSSDLENIDFGKFDTVIFLQLIWAMAKADAFGKQFPSFVEWVSDMEAFDLADPSVVAAALEEATSGFFRSRRGGIKGGISTR